MAHKHKNTSTSRREFLRVGLGGLAVFSLAGTVPSFVSDLAYARLTDQPGASAAVSNDNILVVVQLSGGNDGLNTVVPVGSDEYAKFRPTLAIKDRLLKLDDRLALNPGMTAFKELYDKGQLAIVNGCGYPEPNRSHFQSMHIWHTADPSLGSGDGWLGHYLDHQRRGTQVPANPLTAVNIGAELPAALVNDAAPVPSIQSIDDFQVRAEGRSPEETRRAKELITRLNSAGSDDNPALRFLSRQSTHAIVSVEQIRKVAAGYKPDANYPGNLGQQLRLIAQIISGQFGTRVFYCQVGGFDTHSNQVGGHEGLLRNVSDSIAAFTTDMGAKGYGEKVTVMCFSEFGRRIAQNDSNGTDHGTAGPMFVVGGKVKGGLHGAYPSLTDTDGGDLKHTTDFRRVYATMLDRWLNAPTDALHGKFEPLAIL